MPVDQTHPEYKNSIIRWQRARDVIEGEDRIKEAREAYVPRLDSMSTTEYQAYINRGLFFNASARTLQGLVGMIFRVDPVVTLQGKELDPFIKDVDLSGCEWFSYLKMTVEQVLTVGRGGSLVDWNKEEARPQSQFYCAESIINWEMTRINGRMMTSLVILKEEIQTPPKEAKAGDYSSETECQYRVLRLDQMGATPQLVVEVWKEKEQAQNYTGDKEYVMESSEIPLRRGQPIAFIPFVFHNTRNHGAGVDKSALDDLFIANVSHFQLNVEFRHGLHYTGLPTAWVAGFPPNPNLMIGSGVAWVSDNPQANAGFLEFKGEGLKSYTTELEKVEKQMAILGARMLEQQPSHVVTAESIRLRAVGENSSLTDVCGSCSASLSKVLKLALWWIGTAAEPEDITDKQASVELNTDFTPTRLDAAEILALVKAWQAGSMSKDTLVWNLQQGGLLQPGRSVEDEIAMIESQPPPVLPSPAAKPVVKSGAAA